MTLLTLPKQMAGLAGGSTRHTLDARNVADAFRQVSLTAPMLHSQIFDSENNVRQFIGLFVNNKQVYSMPSESEMLAPDSEILIIKSVAGG